MGRVVTCPDCDMTTMIESSSPRLITCAYDELYFFRSPGKHVGYPDYFGAERPLREQVARCFAQSFLKRFPLAKTALDIGCGGGYLVEAFAHVGLKATGVDPSHHVLAGAAPSVRPRLVTGDVASPAVADAAPYDLVTVMDVIEHIADPIEFLARSWSMVNDQGVLAILTPRFGGWLFGEQQADYVHFNVDHAYYFTEVTLRECVRAATGVTPTNVDPLTFWRSCATHVPSVVAWKYGHQRDSMLAICAKDEP